MRCAGRARVRADVPVAVDSSILFDVFLPDPVFGERSRQALADAYSRGALIVCDVVWAEVRGKFPDDALFLTAVEGVGLAFDAIEAPAAAMAGRLRRDYRTRYRGARERIVADFLIGAHAQLQADALLTRDRGFYRKFFKDLRIIDPTRRHARPR